MGKREDDTKRLRDDLVADLGKALVDKLDDLNKQAAEAAVHGDWDRASRLEAEIEKLLSKPLGAEKARDAMGPASKLTSFFRKLTGGKGIQATPPQASTKVTHQPLSRIRSEIPVLPKGYERLTAVLQPLLPGPIDDDERWDLDYKVIRANIGLFDETALSALLSGAEQCLNPAGIDEMRERGLGDNAPRAALVFAKRLYEIAQRVADVRGDSHREGFAAFKEGMVCEELGLIVGAIDGYEIARQAAKRTGDMHHYLVATFNQARACMMYPGLDYKAIGLLEETIPKAEEQNHEEILTRSCNLVIHLYEKQGKVQDVERIRSILQRNL